MKISVALCTYNGASFLKEQIESIINQTVPVNEIVICDDCSNDATLDILKDFKVNFPEIISIHKNQKSLGTLKNFEKAISLTKGELIFLSDQDDIWDKDKVKIMSKFFHQNPKCKLLFTNGFLIDDQGKKLPDSLWEKWNFSSELKEKWKNNSLAFFDLLEGKNKITGATVCFRKKMKNISPFFNSPLYFHDAFLGLHAAAQNGLFFLDEKLISYRIHDQQQVGIAKNTSLEQFCAQNPDTISHELFKDQILNLYKNKKLSLKIKNLENRFFRKFRSFFNRFRN